MSAIAKTKFNALAAVKLMAQEHGDEDDEHANENAIENDDFAAFLKVTVEEGKKPIKGILKKKEELFKSGEDSVLMENSSQDETETSQVQPKPVKPQNVAHILPCVDRHVVKLSNVPLDVKAQDFIMILGIWPSNGYDGIKFICDSVGDPSGCAYLEVDSHRDKMSLIRISGVKLKNNPIKVISSAAETMEQEWEASQKVLKQIEISPFIRIGNLPFSMSEKDIKKILLKYRRKTEDIYIRSEKAEHRNSGYCYVIMDNTEQADNICNSSLIYNYQKLVVRKIHPEVLGRWCKRYNMKMIVREKAKKFLSEQNKQLKVACNNKREQANTDNMKPTKAKKMEEKDTIDNKETVSTEVKSNVVKTNLKQNSTVFVYDPDNLDELIVEYNDQSENSKTKQVEVRQEDEKSNLVVVYDAEENDEALLNKNKSSKSGPKTKKQNKDADKRIFSAYHRSSMSRSPVLNAARPPFPPGPFQLQQHLPPFADIMRHPPPGIVLPPRERLLPPGVGPPPDLRIKSGPPKLRPGMHPLDFLHGIGPPHLRPPLGPPDLRPHMGPPNMRPGMGPPDFRPSYPPDLHPRMGPPDLHPRIGPPDLHPKMGPPDLPPRMGPLDLHPRMGPPDLHPRMGPPDLHPRMGPPDLHPRMGPPDLRPSIGPPVIRSSELGPGLRPETLNSGKLHDLPPPRMNASSQNFHSEPRALPHFIPPAGGGPGPSMQPSPHGFHQRGPPSVFPFRYGMPPTIHIRMYDVPEQANSDDIKDFFHPVVPSKITQNVGTDIYDVDFFSPNDALACLSRSGLLMRKNVIRLEMLPGPFVPLPPQMIKAKKKSESIKERPRKRKTHSPLLQLEQPPPMPIRKSPEISPPKPEEKEEPIIVAPFPDDPLEYRLKPYDSSIPEGQCVIQPMKGYFCQICRKFYKTESSALLVHCKSRAHYDNVKLYVEKMK